MIIRLADVRNESEQIIVGVRDFISRMDFTDYIPEDREWFEKYIIEVLSSDTIEVVVAEDNGIIVAGLGMAYGPMLWNPGLVQAEELFWWAAEDAPPTAALRVLRNIMDRVKDGSNSGRTFVSFKRLTSSPEGVGRVYEKMGLREVETNYVGVF